MEAAGLSIGVVALAGLFNNVIVSFEYLQLGRNIQKDFAIATLRLDNARLRLSRWGEAVGLSDAQDQDAPAFPMPDISNRVGQLLEQIVQLFEDAEDVSRKFRSRNQTGDVLQVYDPHTDLALVGDINALVNDLVELFPAKEIQQRLANVEVSELSSEQAFPALEGIAAEQDTLLTAAIERTSNERSSVTNNWNNYGKVANQAGQQNIYGGQTFTI